MSRNNLIIIVLTIFLFNSCADKRLNSPKSQITKKSIIKDYEKENEYLLYALDLKARGNYKNSAKYFTTLYKKTKKLIYIKEAIENYIILKDLNSLKSMIDLALKDYPDNLVLNRYLVAYYVDSRDFLKAKAVVEKLLKIKKDEKNLELAGVVYSGLKDYKFALKYFQSAYNIDQNEQALMKLTNLLYNNLDQKSDAISYLETHIRLKGCGEIACYRLLQIYGEEKNVDALISTYKRLYQEKSRYEFGKRLVELYFYQNKLNLAIDFLKKTDLDDEMLLDAYITNKDYKLAKELANRLYDQTGDSKFLAKSAIIEYELMSNKSDLKSLQSILDKLDRAIKDISDPTLFNYLGYLLIDHDINIKKGIELVKKALKIEPDNLFYLDSLAWGLYKDGKCQEAYDILKDKMSENKEQEIKMHFEKIKKCLEAIKNDS